MLALSKENLSSYTNFRTRKINRNKEEHYIIIKASILKEEIPCMELKREYQNTWAKTDRTKRKIDKSTIIVGCFSITLWITNKQSRQKTSKDIDDLNINVIQFGLITFYRILHPTIIKHTFPSSSYGTFINIDHILFIKHTLKILKVQKSYKVSY